MWVVVDARRPTDVDYFCAHYNVLTVRVTASDETRASRGFKCVGSTVMMSRVIYPPPPRSLRFTAGVDDAPSECALDDRAEWDLVVENNSDTQALAPHFLYIAQRALPFRLK